MLGDRPSPPEVIDVPEAEVVERRGFSLVWLIPRWPARSRSGSATPRSRARAR